MSIHADAAARSKRRFVGRAGQIAGFREALARHSASVWWVFGPGGIGKSHLLDVLADQARAARWPVAHADMRLGSTDGSLSDLLADIGAQLSEVGADRVLVVLDGLVPSPLTERWLRTDLLPALPSHSVVLIGSRQGPGMEWRSDPTWSSILRPVPLRGLSDEEGRQLLELAGVPPELAPQAMQLSRGHPLALTLLAETVPTGDERSLPDELESAPDLVAVLLSRLVEGLPDDPYRRAIELACLSRVVNRSVLRELCDPDMTDALFDWLAAQPWMDRLPGGLCPHDLARDVIAADLASNDPDRYTAAKRALRGYILEPERLRSDPKRSTSDYVHLHRRGSLLRSAWDWGSFGQVEQTGVRPGDRIVLADLVSSSYGPESVAVLDHWLDRQPEAFTVVRSADEIVGLTAMVVIGEPTAGDLEADPSMAAVWRCVERRGVPAPGETIGLSRFVCDRVAGTLPPSPTYNVTTLVCTERWLTSTGLSLDYIVKPVSGSFKPMMDYIDFHEVPEAHHLVGSTEMVVYEHDWHETSRAPWLDRMEALEAGAPIVPASDSSAVLVALDEVAFADAVRAALRDLTRPGRLADNPLIGTRLVRDETDLDGPDALRQILLDGFDALDDHPRNERARRAIERTYFHGAVTQEAAAEVLGLPFSTYRRHLSTGIALLVERLWQWELYGRDHSW